MPLPCPLNVLLVDNTARMKPADLPPHDALLAQMLLQRPRVLAVDDQDILLEALKAVFGHDHDVAVTNRADEAPELAAQFQPDLILLDVVMPGTDGHEICRRLKADAQTRDIPVVFLTARSDPDSEAQGLSLGAVDFIAKPFSPQVVRARVRTHVMLKRQSDLLRRWVFVDGLTGIANRRHFDEQLAAEWGRAERSGKPLSVLLLDVDRFKDFNDRWGHQAGDDCLRLVARSVAEGMRRAGDLVARYGGEEFVCLLPDTDENGALHLAEALRAQVPIDVEASSLRQPDWPPVTVCIGVGTLRPGATATVDDLLFEADHNLYRAKVGGRNAVCHGPAPAARGTA